MRVLHIIPSLELADGGPTRAVLAMQAALAGRGLEVTIATTAHHGEIETIAAQPGRAVFRRALQPYKVAPAFIPWAWRHVTSYDVVHVHALFSFVSDAGAAIARARGVPYVVRPLGTLNRYGRSRRPLLKRMSIAALQRPLLRDAAFVHFTSDEERLQTCEHIPECHGRAATIPLGLELPTNTRPGVAREQLALGRAPYVLFIGRLDPVKNVEGLLRTFALLRQRHGALRLVVAGPGESAYVASLQALCVQLGVVDAVVWTGHVDGAMKRDLLADAELFMLCSHSESFGIAAAEALMAGIPCVLGPGVAIAADTAKAGAAVIVDANDAPRAASSLADLLAAPERLDAMRRNARGLAASRFSMEAMSRSLESMYLEARARGARASSRTRSA